MPMQLQLQMRVCCFLVLLLIFFFFHSAVSVVLQRATILLSYCAQPMCKCVLLRTQAFQGYHEECGKRPVLASLFQFCYAYCLQRLLRFLRCHVASLSSVRVCLMNTS